MSPPKHSNHDHDTDSHGHDHGDVISRIVGPRAEIIFAGLAGLCLLAGWLGPKLGFRRLFRAA
jgi:Cd2+/Zn2+-exporting ATPase